MRLDGDGFSLRSFREDDLDRLVELANDDGVSRNLRDRFPHPYTPDDGRHFIAKIALAEDSGVLAIEVDGSFAGGIGAHALPDVNRIGVELGYWLGRPYWGRGIASSAVGVFVPWVFERFPEVHRVQACVYESNPASSRVLAKNGFLREGVMRRAVIKRGVVLDQEVWARLRED